MNRCIATPRSPKLQDSKADSLRAESDSTKISGRFHTGWPLNRPCGAMGTGQVGGKEAFPIWPPCDAHAFKTDLHTSAARIAKAAGRGHSASPAADRRPDKYNSRYSTFRW